jgi:hypothetical protein
VREMQVDRNYQDAYSVESNGISKWTHRER